MLSTLSHKQLHLLLSCLFISVFIGAADNRKEMANYNDDRVILTTNFADELVPTPLPKDLEPLILLLADSSRKVLYDRSFNLSDIEPSSQQSYQDLRSKAHAKGLPWVLLEAQCAPLEKEAVQSTKNIKYLDYLDAFTFLSKILEDNFSNHTQKLKQKKQLNHPDPKKHGEIISYGYFINYPSSNSFDHGNQIITYCDENSKEGRLDLVEQILNFQKIKDHKELNIESLKKLVAVYESLSKNESNSTKKSSYINQLLFWEKILHDLCKSDDKKIRENQQRLDQLNMGNDQSWLACMTMYDIEKYLGRISRAEPHRIRILKKVNPTYVIFPTDEKCYMTGKYFHQLSKKVFEDGKPYLFFKMIVIDPQEIEHSIYIDGHVLLKRLCPDKDYTALDKKLSNQISITGINGRGTIEMHCLYPPNRCLAIGLFNNNVTAGIETSIVELNELSKACLNNDCTARQNLMLWYEKLASTSLGEISKCLKVNAIYWKNVLRRYSEKEMKV